MRSVPTPLGFGKFRKCCPVQVLPVHDSVHLLTSPLDVKTNDPMSECAWPGACGMMCKNGDVQTNRCNHSAPEIWQRWWWWWWWQIKIRYRRRWKNRKWTYIKEGVELGITISWTYKRSVLIAFCVYPYHCGGSCSKDTGLSTYNTNFPKPNLPLQSLWKKGRRKRILLLLLLIRIARTHTGEVKGRTH